MKKHHILTFSVFLCSFILLILAISSPFIFIKVSMDYQQMIEVARHWLQQNPSNSFFQMAIKSFLDNMDVTGHQLLYNKTQSIFEVASNLWLNRYHWLAILIVLFSIIIPVFKLLLLMSYCFVPNKKLLQINSLLSKWSMADVFTIAIFMSSIALGSFSKETGLIVITDLKVGFYWFISYCIVSIAGAQILSKCLLNKI